NRGVGFLVQPVALLGAEGRRGALAPDPRALVDGRLALRRGACVVRPAAIIAGLAVDVDGPERTAVEPLGVDLDANGLPVRRDGLRELVAQSACLVRPVGEVDLEAIGIAGVLEELLRLLRVIRVAALNGRIIAGAGLERGHR